MKKQKSVSSQISFEKTTRFIDMFENIQAIYQSGDSIFVYDEKEKWLCFSLDEILYWFERSTKWSTIKENFIDFSISFNDKTFLVFINKDSIEKLDIVTVTDQFILCEFSTDSQNIQFIVPKMTMRNFCNDIKNINPDHSCKLLIKLEL